MSQRTSFTSPVGRMVMGSLYKPNTTDAEGKPLVFKTGAQAGQPRVNYFIAIAIKKGAEQHWAQTSWGAIIWAEGHKAFPQAAQSPAFAWKVEDGDSTTANKKGRRPVDNDGWAGHWVLKFSGGYSPDVYQQESGKYVQVTQPEFIKPGYYIQIAGTVDGNGSQSQPGIYLNHNKVLFSAYGQEIVFGVSAEEAFGNSAPAALPAGASLTPLAATIPLPGAGIVTPPSAPAVPSPSITVPAPLVGVVPNPGFLAVPLPTTIAPPPPPAPVAAPLVAPPPASGPQMTAKANGVSYQAYIQGGWTDAQLIANGLMTI